MSYIITDITAYDSKRDKVSLDYGEVTFLLYKASGERSKPGEKQAVSEGAGGGGPFKEESPVHFTEAGALKAGDELSEEKYRGIIDGILIPRARKRAVHLLKNSDKTSSQVRAALEKALYPAEAVDKALEFLSESGFTDDRRYAAAYAVELKEERSRREIEAKLYQKGLDRETVTEALEALTEEDEYRACLRAAGRLSGKGPDKLRGYLFRRGFDPGAVRAVMEELA